MCYHNRVKITNAEKIFLQEIQAQLTFPLDIPQQSGFEYENWPVLKPAADCSLHIVKMEWGFVPFYLQNRRAVKNFREGYKDEKGKYHTPVTTLNAIGEELLLPGKMYREAALKRRCLVVSSGFYEWRHVFPLGKKGLPLKTSVKYPYHIKVKDAEYFFMAGIWQPWTDKETGETIDTFALITTKANRLMEQIHNSKKRMPTILPGYLAAEWINDELSENRITELATFQFPASQMEAFTIQKDFRNTLDPVEEFTYAGLPELIK